MKIYAINLPQCHDRRENILRECASFDLEAEIFPGVDGTKFTEEELRRTVYLPDENPLTPGEIGCALSHRGIYEKMLRENVPVALVLEDDSVFKMDPRPLLAGLAAKVDAAPCICLLSHRGNICIKNQGMEEISGTRIFHAVNGHGANGYIVNSQAARNLLSFQTPVRAYADFWKLFLLHGLLQVKSSELEYVGLHGELSPDSRIGSARRDRAAQISRYHRRLRQLAPIRNRLRYLLWKFFVRPFLTLGGT